MRSVLRQLGKLTCQFGATALDQKGGTFTIRYPLFRAYLQHKAETTWSRQEVDALYVSAGEYSHIQDGLPPGKRCI